MKYIALLRGVNAGDATKVSMSELKACAQSLGFKEVTTVGNSGNVLFDSDKKDTKKLAHLCKQAIAEQFDFTVSVIVISAEDFIASIDRAPRWWAADSPDWRHDAIFVMPPARPSEIVENISLQGQTADEKIESYKNVIFWSVRAKVYAQSKVVKMIINRPQAYAHITLRSSTTTKRLYKLLKERGPASR